MVSYQLLHGPEGLHSATSRWFLSRGITFRRYKRLMLPALLVAALLLILLYTHGGILLPYNPPSTYISACPSRPPLQPYSRNASERFDWRSVPEKHPVGNLLTLSQDPPQTLRQIQHQFGRLTAAEQQEQDARQAAVKATFQRCWTSYRQHAWLKDELAPLSGGAKNTFGGYGATLVDALDTLWIMDMHEEFEAAIAAAVNIDFSPPESEDEIINVFETTIRYLGGFLAAFDLTDCKDYRLLDKAVEIGDMIYKSFDTPSRMPVTRWSPRKAVNGVGQDAAENAIIAELGSSSLEFTRLSQLTGDMRHYDAIQRITNIFDDQQYKTALPGMWPIAINARTPDLTVGRNFGVGAMADSAFEYFPKMFALLSAAGPNADQYRRIYEGFVDTMLQHMLYRPMVPDSADILISGNVNVRDDSIELDTSGQHLTCFAGGMLALGGMLIDNATHVETGKKLTDGCVWTYHNSPLGIGPEMYRMIACPNTTECEWNETQWLGMRQHENTPLGFAAITDARYILRPEAIESVFYMYRITSNKIYQDIAWHMFTAIEEYTRTDLANAALKDVTMNPPEQSDEMESFWLAETLKYFYLIFSDPGLISLDDFVFNTEAHPFRRPR